MSAAALKAGADTQTALAVLDMLTTDEALDYLFDKGFGEKSMTYITERIDYYLKKRAGEELDIRCIVFSNARGLLGETAVPFIS